MRRTRADYGFLEPPYTRVASPLAISASFSTDMWYSGSELGPIIFWSLVRLPGLSKFLQTVSFIKFFNTSKIFNPDQRKQLPDRAKPVLNIL